jgi:hypothetical protein
MRWKATIVAGALAPLGGCNVYQLAAHNLANEPVQFADELKVKHRLKEDADRVWKAIACQYPHRTFSKEFQEGFETGYEDYLDSGGKASPPLVPPLKFRRSKYMCPSGHALIRDYFAGFKYGTEVACASGQRQFLTVPVLIPVTKPDAPLNISTGEDQAVPAMPPPPPLPSEEEAAGRKPAAPLGPPQPVPAPVVPVAPPPGAVLPRIDVPALPPAAPSPAGRKVPTEGKVRTASATGNPPPAVPAAGFAPAVDPPAGLPAVADMPGELPAVGEPPR